MSRFDDMQAHALDGSGRYCEGAGMTRTTFLLTLAAAAALAGCNKEDHTIVAGPDTETNAAQQAAANEPSEPLAELGVAPGASASDNNSATEKK